MADACLELELLWIELQAAVRNLPLQPSKGEVSRANVKRGMFRIWLGSWTDRFQQFRLSAHGTKSHRFRIVILRIRSILVEILMRIDITNMEAGWDEFDDDFAKAILLTEVLCKQDEDGIVGLQSVTPMLTKILQFVATKCRNPVLRRRTITILAVLSKRFVDQVYNQSINTSYTQIIDAIVNMEERAWSVKPSGKFSCRCRRVRMQ